MAGKPKWYVNLYFLRFAKMMAEGGEEGGAFVYRAVVDSIPYCLGASFEYGGAIETLVVFYGVAVLDDAFGAAERWRGIVRRQRIRVYLYSHRSRRMLSRTNFI